MRLLLSLSIFLWLILAPSVKAVWFELPSTGTKCVSEELHNNVVVIADYAVIPDSEHHAHVIPTVSLKVTSPYGNNLHHQENVTHGQFAFTTTESGTYLACFWTDIKSESGKGASVSLDWKTGVSAKDWDSVAKKDNIEGLELELRKLEGLVDAIHENLKYLKNRESEMREVSEATNARVAWFSIMSIGLCISVSGFQLWYLKSYFHKKKLI